MLLDPEGVESRESAESDDEDEAEDEESYDEVPPVADQSLVLVAAWVSVAAVVLADPLLSVAVAVLGDACSAMLPPRPSTAAKLPAAAIFRARRAGCARFLRGVGSGMAHSSGRWRVSGRDHRRGST